MEIGSMPPHSNLAEPMFGRGVCLQGSTGLLLISPGPEVLVGALGE